MAEYKKKVINRLRLMVTGLLGAAAAILFSARYEKPETSEFFSGFVGGFQSGLAICFLGVLIVLSVRYIITLRNPEKLKKQYVSETDERKLFIKQKTGDVGMNIIIYGLMVSTAVSGNINDTVFLTLLCATAFVSSVRAFLKIYYNKII